MAPQCVLCASASAAVFCVNDEAHLCAACDQEAHSNLLSSRHERIPVATYSEQVDHSFAGQLQLDTVPSLPFDMLLEVNLSEDLAQFVDSHNASDDLDTLLSCEPGAPLDFGIDLDQIAHYEKQELCLKTKLAVPAQQSQLSMPLPSSPPVLVPATGNFSGDLCHTDTSCKGDAVVPILPAMDQHVSAKSVELLSSESCTPSSPVSRVVTTGSPRPAAKKQITAKAYTAVATTPVQTAGGAVPAVVSSWMSAPTHKPDPVTTNAAAAGAPANKCVAVMPGPEVKKLEGVTLPQLTHGQCQPPPSMSDVSLVLPPSAASQARSSGEGQVVVSPTFMRVGCGTTTPSGLHQSINSFVDTETRAEKLARYRAKKARRRFHKRIRYQTRKDYAEVRPRIKGRFVSPEEYAAWKAAQERPMEEFGHHEDCVQVVPTT